MIGTKLGSYEIVEQIGEGGMATVYRAYQPSVDRYVAVKVIRPSIAEDEGAMARFQREARVVARLEHVHVLPIHDFSLDPPYLVMRYLEGGTLKDALRRGRLPLGEVGFLLRQVSAALDYAHRQGVVHRDVKPSNVLLDGQGNAYVGDFGIARVAGQEMTQSGALIGTPGYIAPEQVMGRGMDHRADLYALAVVAFEMLTGRLPYPAESPMEALFKHVNEPVPSACALNAELPAAVDEVLGRAMAKDPASRYGTASELAEAIVGALGGTVARTPRSLQEAAAESVRMRLEEREEHRDEIEATLARFAAERGAEPFEGMRHTPTEGNRLVTALYANLAEVAAGDFAPVVVEGEGAEAVRDTLERLWERLEGAIADHGGWVQVRTYETALALWGVEAAREDDPERAIRAALAMQDAVREFLDEGEGGEPLPMQVGITTGLALLAPAEGDTSSRASGPTISLAHRLERVAPPGCILISHDTYRHVRGVFDVEAGDPLRVRGRRRALETYRVRAARPRAYRRDTRGVEGVETRMVGRRAELDRLQEAFYTAVEEGETQVVTVVGEPGLGKSRLLYEFNDWIELEEVELWLAWGRATPEGTQRPYALLRDLFSSRFGIRDSDSLAEARAKLEQGILQSMDPAGLGDPPPRRHSGPIGMGSATGGTRPSAVGEGGRMAHFIGHLIGYDYSDSPHLVGALADVQGFHQEAQHHLVQFLLHVARRTPAVLQLADIHWADGSSLDAINGLVRGNPELSLLVVCLARPELYQRRPAWGSGQPFHVRLDLRPLSRRESRRLVAEILQRADQVPDALRDLIVERAEGNPFYVEELIKVLIEDRVIVTSDEAWRVEPERLSAVRVPSTLTGLIQARLDGLFPAERAVLQRAAVVGRVFWDDAVRALGAADDFSVEVTDALRGLAERGLVHVRAESAFAGAQEYIYASNVLRDVVLESILGRQRRAYHVLVAEWLIERGGERVDEYAGEIADHLERGGETERAVPYLRRAGERAAAQYANDQAIAYFSRALDLVPEGKHQERYALLLGRERVHDLRGDREAQQQDLAELRALVSMLEDDRRSAEVALREANYALFVSNDRSATIASAQKAIRHARLAGDVASEAEGYLLWGKALPGTHKDDVEPRKRLEQALRLSRTAGSSAIEADSLRELGLLVQIQGDRAAALSYQERSLQVYREMGNRLGEGRALNALGGVAYLMGDYAAARRYLEQGLRLCRETGSRFEEAWSLENLASVFRAQHEYPAALVHFEQSLRIFREVGNRQGEAYVLTSIGSLFYALGDYARARTYYEQALDSDLLGEGLKGWTLAHLGLLYHQLGEDEEARERCAQVVLYSEGIPGPLRPLALICHGHALAGLGQLDEAADAYRQALGFPWEPDRHHLAASARAGLARVALAQGERRQALAHVEEILNHLEAHPTLDESREPLRIYLTCYLVLRANGDARAGEVLENGYNLLREWAGKIDDEDLRRSFLENVAAHRDIVAAWEE